MSRQQIVLTIFGIALVVLLFTLPKVVVDNEAEMAEAEITTGSRENATSDVSAAHSVELTDSDREKIQSFKQQLKNPNKTAIFADSLASLYLMYQELDSVAKYADMLASQFNTLEAREKAGNYYYEAFGFAADQGAAQRYGMKVRELLGEVLQSDPGNLRAKARIAMTHVSSSNPMRGIVMLREILEADPDNEEALYNMGILSMQSGQYDKAVERFEHLLEVNPGHVQAMFYAGVSYKELGKKEQARSLLERAKAAGNDPAVTAAVDAYLNELN